MSQSSFVPAALRRASRKMVELAGVAILLLPISVAAAQETRSLELQRATIPLSEIQGTPLPTTTPAVVVPISPDVQRLYESARDLVAEGDFDAALAALNSARARSTTNSYEVLALLAEVQTQLGLSDAARADASTAIALRPESASMNELMGRLLLRGADTAAALPCFRRATLAAAREPRNPAVTAAWFQLGQCLAATGYWTAAVEAWTEFDAAIGEDSPEHRTAPQVSAILEDYPHGAVELRVAGLTKLGRTRDAVAVASEAMKRAPDQAALALVYVDTLLAAGDAAAAFAVCRDRLAAPAVSGPEPTGQRGSAWDPRLIDASIRAAHQAGELTRWIAELAQQVQAGGVTERARAVATRMEALGEAAASLPLCQAIAEASPTSADAAFRLAGAHKATGKLTHAIQTLTDFVRGNAENIEIPPGLLAQWMRNARVTDEFLRLVQSLAAQPDQDFADRLVQGLLASAARQSALGEQLLADALKRRPDLPLTQLALGHLYLADYRWNDARSQAESVLAKDARRADAQFLLAQALEGLDQTELALEAYRRAAKLNADDPQYPLGAARFAYRTGNLAAAQRYFQQALDLNPADETAFEGAIESYLKEEKSEIAIAIAERGKRLGMSADTLRRVRTMLAFPNERPRVAYVEELRRQHAAHPADGITGIRLARALIEREDYGAAQPVIDTVVQSNPDDDRAASLLARVQYRRMEYVAAIRILNEITRRYPNRIEPLALLAACLQADFRIDEARVILRRLEALDVSATERRGIRNELLRSWTEFGEFDPALEQIELWQKEANPADAYLWQRLKLETLIAAGRSDAAKAAVDAMLKAARENAAGSVPLDVALPLAASVAAESGDLPGAANHLREALQRNPGNWDLIRSLSGVLIDQKRFDEALALLSTFVSRSPIEMFDVMRLRAVARSAAGETDAAEAELLTMLGEPFVQKSPSDRAMFQAALVDLLETAGRRERALALAKSWLEESSATDPLSRYQSLRLLHALYLRQDQPEESIRVMEEMLALEPKLDFLSFIGLYNDLGYTYADRGERLDQALEMIRRAVAADPLNAAYLDSLGWVYYRRGDAPSAQLYLGRAARLRLGKDPVVLDHLGDADYRLDDRDAARRHWQQALALLSEEKEGQPPNRDRLMISLQQKLTALNQNARAPVAPFASEMEGNKGR